MDCGRDIINLAIKYTKESHSREGGNPELHWMPVEDSVINGDQVRHDGFRILNYQVNNR